MKNIKTIKVIGAVIALGFAQTTHAALSITGSAFDSVSIGLSTGVNLSTGFVSLGYYSSAPTTSLFSSYTSASSFLNNFTSIASGSTGIDTGSAYYPALFSVNATRANGATDVLNKQFYLLIGNGASISASTQLGVLTDSTWVITSNPSGATPVAITFEVAAVASNSADRLWGTFSAGTSPMLADGVADQFKLQAVDLAAVPEPSVASLFALGTVGLVALRARRKS